MSSSPTPPLPDADECTHAPPALMMAACKAAFTARNDARYIAALVYGLDPNEVHPLLPALLKLPPDQWGAIMRRILRPQPRLDGKSVLSPTELLVALLGINPSTHSVPLKSLIAAVSTCLHAREQFTNEALGAALQQAVQWTPLPPLFMRTVLQAHGVAPELKTFLLSNVLTPLLGKQIWKDKSQWRGWLMAVVALRDEALPLLLQLPPAVLQEALQDRGVAAHRGKLAQLAASPAWGINIPQASRQLLLS